MTSKGDLRQRFYTPKINQVAEMYEIACNFVNPLEVIREAIANAYDENAEKIYISADVNEDDKLILKFSDDGLGMDEESLITNFWGLGYTGKQKDSTETIGEKSHGTLIYLRSEKVIVETFNGFTGYRSIAEKPLNSLRDGKVFQFSIEEIPNNDGRTGTDITLIGFNQNIYEDFTNRIMKDYIYWFTKLGSFENELRDFGFQSKDFKVFLRGVDYYQQNNQLSFLDDSFEECSFGHVFPPLTIDYRQLIEEKRDVFWKFYVNRWTGKRRLYYVDGDLNKQEIEFEYVIYYEGDAVKKLYNPALKPTGVKGKSNLYPVNERYGVWLAKDFVPFQNINNWIPSLGTGSVAHTTALHGFVNCQALQLTSDRNAMASTNPKLANELKLTIQKIIKDIVGDLNAEGGLFYLRKNFETIMNEIDEEKRKKGQKSKGRNRGNSQGSNQGRNTGNSQGKQGPDKHNGKYFDERVKRIKNKSYFEISGVSKVKSFIDEYESAYTRRIYEPFNEAETYGVFMEVYSLFPDKFPFTILDYSAQKGIDLLVEFNSNVTNPSVRDKIYYLELKHIFYGKNFNHPFNSLAYIVCWDIDNRILSDYKVTNNKGEEAYYTISNLSENKRYYLEQTDNPIKIQILPLKRIIEELGFSFKS